MLQLQFLNFAKPPLWLVEPTYQIGSAAQCSCVIDLPGVLPHHAQLLIDNDQAQLTPVAAHTAVNGTLISGPTLVGHGDTLELGGALIAVVDPKLARKATTHTAAAEVSVDMAATQIAMVARSSWYLQPMSTALEPNVHELIGKVVLGRAKECDVRLNFAHLSRRHAVLTVTPEGLELEDLGSSNGTFVNDVKVRRVMLKNGDVLSFDNLRFRIVGPEEESDKTQLRPIAIAEENPTYLRPEQAPIGTPMAAAIRQRPGPVVTRPSGGQDTDDSQRGRMFLLVGALLVVLLFVTLIFFLLQET
ncbi:MAG: hypothetical protein RL497_442 [Pseudomonadota bacterium]|jgi:pSer/pThr/pTyr-binding forkhead associated (FHA) protein